MKKFTRWALVLGLCLALLVCGALAAEESTVTVQLDGQPLAFTDAVPQVKDQRTFLPFRAVFEAMGAEVDYEGSVITATRGGKSLAMTLDQTTASVTEDGVTTPITMDVAPYVDPATWRTYVPVRFAAQAFNCMVGWDQSAQTAIIIDTDKLLTQALEGKSYTYLEKLAALDAKYDAGIWDMSLSMGVDASMGDISMLDILADATGTVQDADKMSMDMDMKMDMSGLMSVITGLGGSSLTPEDQAVLSALATDGVSASVRGDMATGKLYMNIDAKDLGAQMGLDSSVWYELDMTQFMKLSGMDMDWAALMAQSKEVNYFDLLTTILAAGEPDNAADDYAQVKKAVDDLAAALSDQSFVADGGKQVAQYALDLEDAGACTLTLGLYLDGDTLTGYEMGAALNADLGDLTVGLDMLVTLDDHNNMAANLSMDVADTVSLNIQMEGGYTPGSTAPETQPPAGAQVLSYLEAVGLDVGGAG